MLILEVLLAIGGPMLQLGLKLLPIMYQYRILKTEAEHREWVRRFQAAVKEAEEKAKAPLDMKGQYDRAKQAAQDMLNGK